MDKKIIAYGALFVILIGLIIFYGTKRQEPVNWDPSYDTRDKIPFGLYVLDKETKTLFNGHEVKKFSITPYEFFDERYDYDNDVYTASGTFLNIEEQNSIDRESVNELINFARHGNTIFLSMKDFPATLLDSLGVSVKNSFYFTDSVAFEVDKPHAVKQHFAEGISFTVFDSISTDSKVLGYQYNDSIGKANLVKVPVGSGYFILHTQPAVFTNFHLLKGNHYKYAQDVLTTLPHGNVYWYTPGFGGDSAKSSSPLRYIWSQPALKWAFLLGILAIIIFIIFHAKRKQRIVPQIEPVRNTTVDFAKTIGNLYFQEGNHHTIAEKKIIYFLEKIRREYNIDTYTLDGDFIEKLHLKSGADKEDIEKAVQLIKQHRHDFATTEADVIEINKAIEKLGL